MSSITLRILIVSTLLAVAAPAAHAFTLAFEGFEPSGDEFFGCGLRIQGTSTLIVVDEPQIPGLAVFGGPSDLLIDGNENVLFEFTQGQATHVSYVVSEIAVSGGAVIEAYDAQLDLVGSVEVSGTGTKDVSALFGDVPLGGFRVTNAIGGHRIGSVSFEPPGRFTSIDLRDATDTQTPQSKYCGVGLSSDGTGDVYVDAVTGVGVGGVSAGALDYFVEPGERLLVEIDVPVRELTYDAVTSGGPPPRVAITAFVVGVGAVGPVEVELPGAIDVGALFSEIPLVGFLLAPQEGDLALRSISFVPEPGSAALGAAAIAAIAVRSGRSRGRERIGARSS